MTLARRSPLALLLTTLAACSFREEVSPAPLGSGSTGGSASSTAEGSGSSGTGGGAPVPLRSCEGSSLLPVADDPAARGPWPVGARTVTIAGLTTEVWYPATPGSEAGKTKARYDLRTHLPDADQGKIPDADNPYQDCDCYRDLPVDAEHGPYPLVVFIHGTAAFRTQSATQMTHWASRGFVVVAADHPGIGLKDVLGGSFGNADQAGDATKLLDALATPTGEAAFLGASIAKGRSAVAGHSAGGGALAKLGDHPGVKVLIPLAAKGASAVSTLIMGAMDDGIVPYSNQVSGYASSPKRKRLVGLKNAGHLAFSDLCFIGRDKGGILQVAIDHGIMVSPIVASLARDGCMMGQLPAEKAWAIVNFATTAALEETLACGGSSAAKLAGIQAAYAEVGEYQEAL